ncbi:MAG: PadR family transcriptional regulator [Firmicutes bacterium]|jgi:DNA-binding PadR family transcriptional regulator|uniref:PadR family transcriptional regulator n=1 Tax=Sulfobacillus benefaciens TaxID=453960 RepID=A0A2T2WY91_9FIRM|nr:PadR family transcriptional regulator [Bacillota bacterium]MCL5015249.1 PadR family transcriptional regulator [Bacillota bacterium]PSR27210.1 MAG: PadR family transcriptional regulator [Sulfobacillus benefaciens]HBQ96638.1 PadR family transcriptional regulator [Sulfobacillus sp.]
MSNFKRYQTGKHLEAFVLLLLNEHPDHGGHLLLRLSEILPKEWVVDSGRIYRLLRELEESGCLTSSWIQHDDAAPVRQYQITPQGSGQLDNWAQELAIKQASLAQFLAKYREITDSSSRANSPSALKPPKTG